MGRKPITKGRRWAPFFVALMGANISQAEDFSIGLPLDCAPSDGCYIRQYVDRDPTAGSAQDHKCGTLANDGHAGTDFAVPTRAEMDKGVDVIAVAPGRVIATRDGMADIKTTSENRDDVAGRQCGNGVLIAHADGWESQYCHLKRGTVTVREGQAVIQGTPLGQLGLSGEASFPHVHLTLRQEDHVIDPFLTDPDAACNADGPGLWQVRPEYEVAALLKLGFADHVPDFDAIEAGLPSPASVPAATPALVVWNYSFAVLAGDLIETEIVGPEGRIGFHTAKVEQAKAFYMNAFGKRTPQGGWPPGPYESTVRLIRGGELLSERVVTTTLE
ncbi:MAG: M23 family metallopeptidase [Pseudomonadota bacterium]